MGVPADKMAGRKNENAYYKRIISHLSPTNNTAEGQIGKSKTTCSTHSSQEWLRWFTCRLRRDLDRRLKLIFFRKSPPWILRLAEKWIPILTQTLVGDVDTLFPLLTRIIMPVSKIILLLRVNGQWKQWQCRCGCDGLVYHLVVRGRGLLLFSRRMIQIISN